VSQTHCPPKRVLKVVLWQDVQVGGDGPTHVKHEYGQT
jgi:hypothetical protein